MNRHEFLAKMPKCTFLNNSFCVFLCRKLITPSMTPFFIRLGVAPNTVTCFMIITGVLSGLILCLPYIWTKFISFLLYILWFSFDCSDGEIARFTNQCSDYGKYLDWYAHQLAHPLFIIGMYFSFMQFYNIDNYIYLVLVSFMLISAELTMRFLLVLRNTNPQTEGKTIVTKENTHTLLRFVVWLKNQFSYFPNYVIFTPLLLAIDIACSTYYLYHIYLIIGLLYTLNVYRSMLFSIIYMLKDK